jgi:adenylate cyclase
MFNNAKIWRGFAQFSPLAAGALTIFIIAAAELLSPGPFERLRLAAFDALQRSFPWNAPPTPVTVVDIDEASLAEYGQWPWPRTTLAALVERLRDLGAASIALDMVFAEPDGASPAAAIEKLPLSARDRLKTLGVAFPDNDRIFAEAIAKGGVTLGFALIARPTARAVRPKASFAIVGGDPQGDVPQFSGSALNLAELEAGASGLGGFSIVAGQDEVVRRMPLVALSGGQMTPSLALEALRVATGEETLRLRLNRAGGGAVESMTLALGDAEIPLDRGGGLLLHHRPIGSIPSVSVAEVLGEPDEAVRSAIQNHIVFVGTSAAGLVDLRPTPLNPFEPGVNLHALVAEQILANHFLQRPLTAAGYEMAAAVLSAAAVLACLMIFGLWAATSAVAFILFAAGLATIGAFRSYGVLHDPTLPMTMIAATYFVASLASHFLANRRGTMLARAFSQYLSPDLVKVLSKNPDQVRLGGEEREMTFLFTDLQGFTSFAEGIEPERLVFTLNAYLDGLCRIATDHGGTIDKIVGDAVHVMFNAPLTQPDHARRAVAAALEMSKFADDFAARQGSRTSAFGATRIGVNTGRAIVGNFGGKARFDYTAHGDAINVAARLEAANKLFGTRILISKATREAAPDIAARPLGALTLRGKSAATEVFEPLPPEDPAVAYASLLAEILENSKSALAPALIALEALARSHPDDRVLARIREQIEHGDQGRTAA